VPAQRLTPLPGHLAQAEGAPLDPENLSASLRQLFATGVFDAIEVDGQRDDNGIALVFRGAPRTFIGVVTVNGAKGATVNTQLESASRLTAGTRFTQAKMAQAIERMRQTLVGNGFNEPSIAYSLTQRPEQQLVDIAFRVVSGPQARVGTVEVSGESGMSLEEFRHHAHLRAGALVDHETVNRALSGVLKVYRGQKRLEAELKLESQTYANRKMNFRFVASMGPVVKVLVEGASVGEERLKRLIPVFEEGTVDDDLLNEGNRRLRNYFQSVGYFDVKVDHNRQSPHADEVVIVYDVDLGQRRRVERVSVDGNRYFNSATLQETLSVHAANSLDHHGAYSQALVASDVSALEAVYQNNGFSKVKVTPETNTTQVEEVIAPARTAAPRINSALTVTYHVSEGEQQRVGTVRLEGDPRADQAKLSALMNTVPGQLLSPQNLAGDRDALTTDYMSRGFDQARVEVTQENEAADPSKVDVVFRIIPGQQIFVRNVLLTGLHYTRPDTVARAITLHAGDPLNESALLETQRNLYEFALFNEINTAVENPAGGETYKTVLLQAVEARRWTLTYGAGFETQTGTPQNNCRGYIASGVPCSPGGKTGVSPRVLLAITRNNLFGREQSASIQGTYGLLEQKVDLIFQNPHFKGNRNFGLTFNAGYANSQDVTTYEASRLDAGMRWTEHFNTAGSFISRANTLIYEFDFRRVKVAEDSLQVFPDEITELATAVRVGGPGFTWIRDTRDSPIDAHRGTYLSFQEFLSAGHLGAEAQFNRLDLTNSSFYGFDKNRFVLARNTRYGQERAFGNAENELIPLPERLYAGGATSIRGFSINAAGPRDPETGYPIGGAGALTNSTELRLPPPTLPYFGNTISLVLFHDMGNVFTNAQDAWVSALRIHQPDRDSCKVLTYPTAANPTPAPTGSTAGPNTSTGQQGICSYNYFSHTPGLGLRYHTPVGPIRLDFSYNLNPPIFPVNVNYSLSTPFTQQHVGEASHFNFFFSLGQTF
jgi:outer membrane protein assembly complex protein YaeT